MVSNSSNAYVRCSNKTSFMLVPGMALVLLFLQHFCSARLVSPSPRISSSSLISRLGPCDTHKSPLPSNISSLPLVYRSSFLPVKWDANQSSSGFVRLSIVPYSVSDFAQEFDKRSLGYYCFSREFVNLEIPETIPDGVYVLQWARFGSAQDPVDRYSCADFMVAGGARASTSAGGNENLNLLPNPVFRSTDGKCNYVNSNRMKTCSSPSPLCGNPVVRQAAPLKASNLERNFKVIYERTVSNPMCPRNQVKCLLECCSVFLACEDPEAWNGIRHSADSEFVCELDSAQKFSDSLCTQDVCSNIQPKLQAVIDAGQNQNICIGKSDSIVCDSQCSFVYCYMGKPITNVMLANNFQCTNNTIIPASGTNLSCSI